MRRLTGVLILLALCSAIFPAYAQTRASSASTTGFIVYDKWTRSHYALVVQTPSGTLSVLSRISVDAVTPKWSPDGKWIAFSGCDRGGRCQLYVVHPDGSGLRQVTHDAANLFTPSWLPDGRTLLAGRHDIEAPDGTPVAGSIVSVSLRTGAETTVYGPADQELLYPTWSDSAKVVVFSAGSDEWVPQLGQTAYGGFDVESNRIDSVHLDGSSLKVVAVGQTPDVSADGSTIAYTGAPTEEAGLEQVHLVGITGQGDHIVGNFGWAGIRPTWAPDDRSLLVSAWDNQWDLHVARLNTTTGLTADLTRPGSWTSFAAQAPSSGATHRPPPTETKTYIQSATGDAGWPMDNCGMPDQGPGLGGVCFNVLQGDVIRVNLRDATGRPVAGFIDVCGYDDCADTQTTYEAGVICGSTTLDLAKMPFASHLWVQVDPVNGALPYAAGGSCPLPSPGTRGTANATYLA